jgi:predicted dehydrogenase
MSKPLRIGILGAAHVHADGFAALLRTIPNLELVGFSENHPAQAATFAANTKLKHFATHRALVDTQPDAVIVCSETSLHLPLVRLAAKAGAHVLCEKPIATTLPDALEMQQVCQEAGVQFMTAYPMRFDPNLIALKKRLETTDLGRVLAMVGINHAENPMHRRAWFADPKLAGGGAVMDHTVHLTDLYRWLLGREVDSLQAEVSNPFYPALEIDSAAFATLSLGDVPCSIDASWSRPVGVYPRWGHLKLEVFLEGGAFEVDAFAQYLKLYSKNTPKAASWLGYGADATRAMLEAFLEAVRSNTPMPVTWQDGYTGLEVALACYTSSQNATVINLKANSS